MCKNNHKHHHCHHKYDKHANPTFGAGSAEHSCQHKNKWPEYKGRSHKENKLLGFDDLVFQGFAAKIQFPNGFAMIVEKDDHGSIERILVLDDTDHWIHCRSVFDMFPELRNRHSKLMEAIDVMITSDAMRKVQELTYEDWRKFRGSL